MSYNKRKKHQKKSQHKNLTQLKTTNSNKLNYILPGLILLITFIAYNSVLKNGFVWDDQVFIINNDMIKGGGIKPIFTNFSSDNYSPVTDLINAIQYRISGLNPSAFHFGSLFFHLLNVLLVFWFVRLINARIEVAAIAALLFGIHPINAESVSWVSAGSNLFCATFILGSLISYLYYTKKNKLKFLILSVFLFILSILSKAVVILFPFVLFLIDYIINRKISAKSLLNKLPFFIVSLIIGLISISLKNQFGTIEYLEEFTLPQRIIFAAYGFTSYLLKLLLPLKLSSYYPYPINAGMKIPALYYLYFVITIVLVALTIYARRYSKKIIFGMGFFIVLILVVLQIMPLGNTIMADRYAYIPSIGIFNLMGAGIFYLWQNKSRGAAITVLGIFTIFFFIKTRDRSKVWENGVTLWGDVVSNYQTDWQPFYNNGVSLMDNEKDSEALKNFNKSIELFPEHKESYFNRGLILKDLNRNSEALKDFNKVIELDSDYARAYFQKAFIFKNENKVNEAIKNYTSAIKLNPNYIDAYFNRGNLYISNNEHSMAIKDFNMILELDPSYINAYINRGNVYILDKKYEQALNDFSKAIELQNNNAIAYYSRGLARYYLGNKNAACSDFKKSSDLGYKRATDALGQFCK